MSGTLEIRFEDLDSGQRSAVEAMCERVAPGAWVTEERRAGFWTRDTAPDPRATVTTVTVYLADDAEGALRLAAMHRTLEGRPIAAGVKPRVVRSGVSENWSESWKRSHRPLKVGRRLLIEPSWEKAAAPADRVVVRLEPGQAFGLGSHPTTQLALELLEGEVRAGDRIADVGCGSGILALAALGLGAARASACDIDPASVEATHRAAIENDMVDRLAVRQGGPESLAGVFECVVVNVVAEALGDMLVSLTERVAEGGRLVTSGMRVDQTEAIVEQLGRLGFEIVRRIGREGFEAMVATPAGGRADRRGASAAPPIADS